MEIHMSGALHGVNDFSIKFGKERQTKNPLKKHRHRRILKERINM